VVDFLQEPPCADDGRQLRVQHLERDLAIVLDVVHEIDGSHTAGPEFALERVTIGERRAQGKEASRGGTITHAGRFRFGHGNATNTRDTTGERYTRAIAFVRPPQRTWIRASERMRVSGTRAGWSLTISCYGFTGASVPMSRCMRQTPSASFRQSTAYRPDDVFGLPPTFAVPAEAYRPTSNT